MIVQENPPADGTIKSGSTLTHEGFANGWMNRRLEVYIDNYPFDQLFKHLTRMRRFRYGLVERFSRFINSPKMVEDMEKDLILGQALDDPDFYRKACSAGCIQIRFLKTTAP